MLEPRASPYPVLHDMIDITVTENNTFACEFVETDDKGKLFVSFPKCMYFQTVLRS